MRLGRGFFPEGITLDKGSNLGIFPTLDDPLVTPSVLSVSPSGGSSVKRSVADTGGASAAGAAPPPSTSDPPPGLTSSPQSLISFCSLYCLTLGVTLGSDFVACFLAFGLRPNLLHFSVFSGNLILRFSFLVFKLSL